MTRGDCFRYNTLRFNRTSDWSIPITKWSGYIFANKTEDRPVPQPLSRMILVFWWWFDKSSISKARLVCSAIGLFFSQRSSWVECFWTILRSVSGSVGGQSIVYWVPWSDCCWTLTRSLPLLWNCCRRRWWRWTGERKQERQLLRWLIIMTIKIANIAAADRFVMECRQDDGTICKQTANKLLLSAVWSDHFTSPPSTHSIQLPRSPPIRY